MLKLAFVAPRYGKEVIGGAEELTRKFAENFVKRGYQVSALATCARDHLSWDNYYKAGDTEENGVKIHRFTAKTLMNEPKWGEIHHKIVKGQDVDLKKEIYWISGLITSPDLLSYLSENHYMYDYLVFTPYLFGTTYQGVQIAPEKSVIIPCLHNEPFAYLRVVQNLFRKCNGIIFNTIPEKELAQRIMPFSFKSTVAGIGFDEINIKNGQEFREKYNIKDPFILYAGRREEGKNTPLLVRYFCNYAIKTDSNIKLVLIGGGKVDIPGKFHQQVIDLGFIPEEDKIKAYNAASLICQPSVNESLSIVILEGWLMGKPSLVHADCDVTKFHVEKSKGGLYFKNYPQFHEALDFLISNEQLLKRMGANGKQYVEANYSWDAVLNRFTEIFSNNN